MKKLKKQAFLQKYKLPSSACKKKRTHTFLLRSEVLWEKTIETWENNRRFLKSMLQKRLSFYRFCATLKKVISHLIWAGFLPSTYYLLQHSWVQKRLLSKERQKLVLHHDMLDFEATLFLFYMIFTHKIEFDLLLRTVILQLQNCKKGTHYAYLDFITESAAYFFSESVQATNFGGVWVFGIELLIKGRFKRVSRTQPRKYKIGIMPYVTHNTHINYIIGHTEVKQGSVGIRLSFCRANTRKHTGIFQPIHYNRFILNQIKRSIPAAVWLKFC